MLNYRKNKTRIKINNLGSLYINYDKISSIKRPIIYIGGQMEHRFHCLEQSGYTFDSGHNLFTGSWFYDYPINTTNKLTYNVENFGENLLTSLTEANIGDVDLITESYGGLIGAYVSSSPLIHKVVAIHPPILGTPLANKDLIEYAIKKLELEYRLLSHLINRLIDTRYGFEKENATGFLNPVVYKNVDLNKFLVVSSTIDYQKEKNPLVKKLYELIFELSKQESDGIVVYDEGELDYLGINYLKQEPKLSHFDAGDKSYIEDVARKTLKH